MSSQRHAATWPLLVVAGACLAGGCAAPAAGPPTPGQLQQMLQQYTDATYHFFPERDHTHRYLVTVRLPSGKRYILTRYACLWTTTGETWRLRQRVLVFDENCRYVAACIVDDELPTQEREGGAGEPPPETDWIPDPPDPPDRQAGAPMTMAP